MEQLETIGQTVTVFKDYRTINTTDPAAFNVITARLDYDKQPRRPGRYILAMAEAVETVGTLADGTEYTSHKHAHFVHKSMRTCILELDQGERRTKSTDREALEYAAEIAETYAEKWASDALSLWYLEEQERA